MLTLVGQGLLGGAAPRAKRRLAEDVLERFALGGAGGRRADSLPLGSQKLVEVCPVNIFDLDASGSAVVVEENEDECVLCDLCVQAAPQGKVRIIKLYE